MGLLDDAGKLFEQGKDKVDDAADEHGEQMASGLDKATDFVDEKTGGKFHDQLEQADAKGADVIEGMRTNDT